MDFELQKARLMTGESRFLYLATPYAKYPDGLDAAFVQSSCIAGWLIKNGVKVYSPIAMTHAIAMAADLDPRDHNIWLPADQPFMNGAVGVIVAMITGWSESVGVMYEICEFERQHKTVMYLDLARFPDLHDASVSGEERRRLR